MFIAFRGAARSNREEREPSRPERRSLKLIALRPSTSITATLPVWFLFAVVLTAADQQRVAAATEPATVSDDYQSQIHNAKCVRITMEMCKDIQYNMTIYPNLLKHNKQEEAEADIKQYDMLVKVRCSADFKFFLCTMFAPVCTMLDYPIPPCRHLCLSAKQGCEDLMRKFGYSWPAIFDCDQLPEGGMCVGENRTKTESGTNANGQSGQGSGAGQTNAKVGLNELECPHTMKVMSRSRHSLLIANTSIEQCSLPCHNDGIVPTFFSAHIRHYLRLWTGAWAVCCCICTLFTIITFLIDLRRFEFPERAILYVAVCYLFVSLTYMIGLVAEDNLSCSVVSATRTSLVTQGIDNFACTATAVAHFFFTTAGIIWWLILCFSWFLVTTLKWGEAPVGQVFSSYFNVIAWFLPSLMVIAVLVTNSVDGDLFTGVCSVGNLRPAALFNFVVVPQAILIAIGLVLFVCGFISIMRIRSYIKGQRLSKFETEAASDKISKLMLRISSFSLLYIVPMIVGQLCTYYQALNMESWLTTWYSTRCLHAQRGAFGFTQSREFCPIDDGHMLVRVHETPEPVLFFVKYLCHFTVGIACAIWTVNGKTFNSYGEFYARVFYGRSRVPTRVH
ncbi:frizzled/Smoothened family membrane region domain-containing protein [Ditylenchus destructor]|uniref:Frizzled/Smoothened family membrane region domain-containing protein n=1 Tax=Ditylenchus destructor TaxID=166010 RepID=A0AAD4MY46_9BILA|nr:frizzled/Smoothened family membrane region domain-containing protein [Ditylenchus destructor]